MRLFLTLSIAAGFTPYGRRVILTIGAVFFFLSSQYLTTFCFFIGALLADLSLHLRASQASNITPKYTSNAQRLVAEHWPYTLVIFAILMGSVAPEDPEYEVYSRTIYQFVERTITVVDGMISGEVANCR
jgi:hypothetical protein